MSPLSVVPEVVDLGFPRVSGDEPSMSIGFELQESFSPRERG